MAVSHSRYNSITASLPKRCRDGHFTSETATWIQKWLKKNPLGLLVFQGGDDGRGYKNVFNCALVVRATGAMLQTKKK
jgi:hypothetical protein